MLIFSIYIITSMAISFGTLHFCINYLRWADFEAVTVAFINFLVWPIAIPLELLLLILHKVAERIR